MNGDGVQTEPVAPLTAVHEGFLVDLGVRRLDVPVPFLEAGGPVNAYAIDDGGGTFTLFDTGVGTPKGEAALDAHLAAHGLELSRLSQVIVSHGHVDHYGNAERLASAANAPVWLHRDDVEKACGDGRWFRDLEVHRSAYVRFGVPDELWAQMVKDADHGKVFARQVDPQRVKSLEDGQRFRFRAFEAVARHLPGHTPGLVCLHAEGPKLLFSNDHLLARVSPNPLLDFVHGEGREKFRSLARYLESARKVRAWNLDAVLPGHGAAFRGHRAVLDGLFGFYEKRQGKVRARLERGPATAFELVAEVFPRWDVPRLFLMLSEVVGAVEVLEDRGLVVRREVAGQDRFELAA